MTKSLDHQATPAVKGREGMYHHGTRSGLPRELPVFVCMWGSRINNSAYGPDTAARDFIDKGVKVAKLALVRALRESSSPFSIAEHAALARRESATHLAETMALDSA
jgi:alkylhydroperoxidase family enzyme